MRRNDRARRNDPGHSRRQAEVGATYRGLEDTVIAELCEEKKLELDQVVRKILHCLKDVELELDR